MRAPGPLKDWFWTHAFRRPPSPKIRHTLRYCVAAFPGDHSRPYALERDDCDHIENRADGGGGEDQAGEGDVGGGSDGDAPAERDPEQARRGGVLSACGGVDGGRRGERGTLSRAEARGRVHRRGEEGQAARHR